jgi:hypothetical protein
LGEKTFAISGKGTFSTALVAAALLPPLVVRPPAAMLLV